MEETDEILVSEKTLEPENQDESCVFLTDITSEHDHEEENADPKEAFVEPVQRGFKSKNKDNANQKDASKKDKTCSFFLQGRCMWGMSGKKPLKQQTDGASLRKAQ